MLAINCQINQDNAINHRIEIIFNIPMVITYQKFLLISFLNNFLI